jgi:hypothetical protein
MNKRYRSAADRFRRLLRPAAGLAVVVFVATIVLDFDSNTTTRATSAVGERVLLISEADANNPIVAGAISSLEGVGFTVLSDAQDALARAASPRVVAFFVTRGAFPNVPASTWQALYARRAIIGGLDVSLHELQPLVRPGMEAGSARLKYNPDRPIFSFLYSLGGCGRAAMSDWLDNWPELGALVQERALEISAAGSRGLPNDCPADQR